MTSTHRSAVRRLRANRRQRLAGTLLVAVTLAGCSSTNQSTPSSDAVSGSSAPATEPTDTTGGGSGDDSAVSVMVVVNDLAEIAQSGPVPPAETEIGAAVLAMVDVLNANRPDGALELRVTLASQTALLEGTGAGGDCSVIFPEGEPLPQVIVPEAIDSTSSILRCYAALGVSAIHTRPTIVTTAQLEDTRGLVLARGVTAQRWATAIAGALDPATDRVVVADAPSSFTTEPAIVEAGMAEVADALAATGLEVDTFTLPDVSPDDPSYDAAMATVPTKLRRLDPDVVVLPGISSSVMPFGVLSSQQFDLPLVVASGQLGALALFQGYRADRVRLLPAVDDNLLDIDATASRMRGDFGETDDGAACLQAIDRDGQRANATEFYTLAAQCEALLLIRAAATAVPGAASSPEAFVDAFASVDTFTTARGDQLSFAAVPQTGLTSLSELVGNAECVCLTPSENAPLPVP